MHRPVFTNYSAGGDGIIAKSGINTVNDLLGKKIGVPRFSEAQTLVAWFVNKSDLSDADKQSIIDNMILFDDASETGEAFFAGQLDVAATWQPYTAMKQANKTAPRMQFFARRLTEVFISRPLLMDHLRPATSS